MRAAWWLLPMISAMQFASPSVTLPRDELGLRRFLTPPLGLDLRLRQTFTMTVDGLHAIDVFLAAGAERVSGDVRFELYEIRTDRLIPVLIVEVFAAEVVRGAYYRFEFAPITDSRARTYRLDLVAARAQGVAFWATKGERYEGGSMHANGRDRWQTWPFAYTRPRRRSGAADGAARHEPCARLSSDRLVHGDLAAPRSCAAHLRADPA